MMNEKTIINEVIEYAKRECVEMTNNVIEGLDFDLTNGKALFQMEYIINDVIDTVEGELIDKGIISEDDNLNDIIYNLNEDVRSKIFDLLIAPVVNYFKNNYEIDIDRHFENIRICYN